MNAVHPMTYHAVKVEQDQRLARLEHQRSAMEHAAVAHRPTTELVRPGLPRRVAVAAASAILMLSLIAGAALAALQAPPGGAPGGGNAPGGGGGGGIHLLK